MSKIDDIVKAYDLTPLDPSLALDLYTWHDLTQYPTQAGYPQRGTPFQSRYGWKACIRINASNDVFSNVTYGNADEANAAADLKIRQIENERMKK